MALCRVSSVKLLIKVVPQAYACPYCRIGVFFILVSQAETSRRDRKEIKQMTNEQNTLVKKRDGFSSKIGFIIACIGSAVGMGNIWMFPYRVGQFGGAAFLVPYFIFVALLGVTGIVGEITLGRSMKTGPLGAFGKAMKRRGLKGGEAIGMIPVIGSLATAIGYTVVMAWIIKFFVGSITGSAMRAKDSGAYFGELATDFGAVPWHIIVVLVTFCLMVFGIAKGIEKVNKFMMPAFFILFVIIAIRVAFLPGAGAGYTYLLKPEWSALADPMTWAYALGQAFFSLSLAGSGTVVYGSYISEKEDIVSSAKYIAVFDTLAAMVAALVIIPAVFAFGMDPMAGPPLMFITMPSIFKLMPLGQLIAIIFFLAVMFAGFTSLVNLYETPIEAIEEKFGISRKTAVGIILGIGLIVGLFIENGDVVSAWMDVISIYIVPLGALLAAVMVYWVCGKGYAREHAQIGRVKPIGGWFEPVAKYVFCGVTVAVYILGIVYGGIG